MFTGDDKDKLQTNYQNVETSTVNLLNGSVGWNSQSIVTDYLNQTKNLSNNHDLTNYFGKSMAISTTINL